MRIELNKDIYFSNCCGVFQGGGCKAIAYIGAYEVAYEHGIMFSELAGTSAGSIIAAAIALGASPKDLKDFVLGLDFNDLVKISNIEYAPQTFQQFFKIEPKGCKEKLFFKYIAKDLEKGIYSRLKEIDSLFFKHFDYIRLFKEYGIFDSNNLAKVLNQWFEKLSGIKNPKFKDLSVKLHVLAGDVPHHTPKVFNANTTPEELIADAVTASCSIPIFFTPPHKTYIDGGVLSNRPDILIENKTNYFRTLSFSLKSNESRIENVKDFVSSIVDTIIIGADEIQHKGEDVEKIEINCEDISATDFNKMTPENINKLIDNGRRAMETFFNQINSSEEDYSTPHIHLHSLEQVYSQVAHWGYERVDSINIVSKNLDWVWRLFPTIVGWCKNGTKLKVYYSDISNEKRQRQIINNYLDRGKTKVEAEGKHQNLVAKQNAIVRFLTSIDAKAIKMEKNLLEGFYFKNGHSIKAILFKEENNHFFGKIYMDSLDSLALTKLLPDGNKNGLGQLKLNLGKEEEIINILKGIPMYKMADFSWEIIDIGRLRFLNKFIRGEKYKQIHHIFNLYPQTSSDIFSAASITLKNGKESLIGPIVVEEHDDKLFVIEGNTRSVFAYKHKISTLKVLIVRNVREALPLNMTLNPEGFSIDQVRISEKGLEAEDRYPGFKYSLFRPIEQTLRPDNNYLL